MGFLKEQSFGSKIFALLGLMLAGWFIGSLFGFLLIKPLFGIDVMADPSLLTMDENNAAMVPVLKFLQLFLSAFLFIIPANIFAYWASDRDATGYLDFHKTKTVYFLLAILIIIAAAPFITTLAEWNEKIHLPDFLKGMEQWIRSREMEAEKMTNLFLNASDIKAMFINLLVIALVPALGEELIFRGILQRLMIEKTKSIHWGVILTAIIFSAIHFQFLGFLPRLVLGAILGYLMVWSGSIWVPITAHFINNGSAVVADYLYKSNLTEVDLNKQENFPLVITLLSFLISFVLIWYFYKKRKSSSYHGERLG